MQDLLTSLHQSLRAANTTEEALDAKTLENHTAQFGNFLYEILGNVHKSQEVRSTVHRTPEAIKVLLNAQKMLPKITTEDHEDTPRDTPRDMPRDMPRDITTEDHEDSRGDSRRISLR